MAKQGGHGAVAERAGGTVWSAHERAPAHRRTPLQLQRASSPARRGLPRCPELDCVRHLLPPAVLALAELQAAETGTSADRVLIARGLIGADAYHRALAAWLHMPFEPLPLSARAAWSAPDDSLLEAATTGLVRLQTPQGPVIVIAPHNVPGLIAAASGPGSDLSRRCRLTTAPRLHRFVAGAGAAALGWRAAHALRVQRPAFSAGSRRAWPWRFAALGAVAAAALALVPQATLIAIELALATLFLAWAGLRAFGMRRGPPRRDPRPLADRNLPFYTVLVALHREASAVPGLLAALGALDYPAEKIEIVLIVEPDDPETQAAIAAARPDARFWTMVAPAVEPRTKPKALNAALPFARGEIVAVYDAEDRPEPNQLRQAAAAFAAGNRRLACVQAAMTIDNTADSWLTRMFTAEYAGQFDVLLPSLARWRVPLPLGGSSNHFRTAILREVGAWDPYNVTEDADLGIRLARFGYRSQTIASSTYEEAPARFRPWLRQRTRWFKGWMQTWLVHMRAPRLLLRQLGLRGFVVVQLLVGGTALAALVHAVVVVKLGYGLAFGRSGTFAALLPAIDAAALGAGYLMSCALAFAGLARRGLLRSAFVLAAMPLYWLMLSAAAWRALVQLLRDPYRWEKTEHGLAATSRRGMLR